MLGVRHLGWFALFAFVVVSVAGVASVSARPMAGIVPVKLGLGSMSKDERKNLWKLVDEYATRGVAD